MNKLLLFIFVFVLVSSLYSYPKLISEKLEGDKLVLTIELAGQIEKFVNKIEFIKKTRQDTEIQDYSEYLRNSLFISIPSSNIITFNYEILETENLQLRDFPKDLFDVIPRAELNYKAEVESRGILYYKGSSVLHLTYYDMLFSESKVISKIKITINLASPLRTAKRLKDDLSINSLYVGEQLSFKKNTKVAKSRITETDYLKVSLARDGIYRIYGNELEGFTSQDIPVNRLNLHHNDINIPVYVFDDGDNIFNGEDYIEFVGTRNMGGKHRELSGYGEPYNEYLNRYSDTTVYFLTWNDINSSNIESGMLNPDSLADTLIYYYTVQRFERNHWFDFSIDQLVRREMPFWYENKTWIDASLRVGVKTINLSLNDVYPGKPFSAFAKFQDWASDIQFNAHLVGISINNDGGIYDSTYVDKYEKAIVQTTQNSNLLNEGNNSVKIHSFATEAVVNSCFFDWAEIEYPRYSKAIDDSLKMIFNYVEDNSLKNIKIDNISADSVIIWKKGSSYKRWNGSAVNNSAVFSDTVNSVDNFFLASFSKILQPKLRYKSKLIDLSSPSNQADYILITHKIFEETAVTYLKMIEQVYGLNSILINIEDIYDNYSYGHFDPEAIKEFLADANLNWQLPKPKYVFLVGSATYDYHSNKHYFQGYDKTPNYVPSFGAPVSDNWFVTWDTTGAYIPAMNIGRLPVKDQDEFNWYLEKHETYAEQRYDEWNKKYIFFSGGKGDSQSELNELRAPNSFIIDNYVTPPPVGGESAHFYKTINPNTNFGPVTPEEFQSVIDQGSLFISYIGHSGTQTWDNSITNPVQLKNNVGRFPLVSDFGCSTARFGEPDIVSFSQLFTLSDDGQAIAYIGNSSLGFLSTATTASKLFYENILKDSTYNISQALVNAKIDLINEYGIYSVNQIFNLGNTLIGDPVANLPIPTKPNLKIESSDISILSSNPNDGEDSLNIIATFYNLGTVINDSVDISIVHSYNNTIVSDNLLKRKIPNFNDSLKISIPTRELAGIHNITISIDTQNLIDEIYEDDNITSLDINVVSTALKTMLSYNIENGIRDSLKILNPSDKPDIENLVVEISGSPDFTVNAYIIKSLDKFYSKVDLAALDTNKRFWIRSKLINSEYYGTVKSFYNNSSYKYLLNDSISISETYTQNLKYSNSSLKNDSSLTQFDLYSAGFNDGNSALISKNSQNFIPENTLIGHHVCLFDIDTYEFVKYDRFNLLFVSEDTDRYINFIDTLSSNYLVCIAISDEGRVTNSTLRDKLRTIGSQYIDNVGWRGSWAIIGRKGAAPGSVPEAYSLSGDGPVYADTTMSFLNSSAQMVTSQIGPSAKWESINLNMELPSNSNISVRPVGIKEDESRDTLDQINITDGVGDLSYIDAEMYPYLELISDFEASTDKYSPELYSFGVDYIEVSELGINYQTVTMNADTIKQGEGKKLEFYIYNVGETAAEQFEVSVDLIKPDNSSRRIETYQSVSIGSESNKRFETKISLNVSDGWGEMKAVINIDNDNVIRELFEDNNIYRIPFYVKEDTTITSVSSTEFNVTFDGYEISDGDYVSPNPEIEIEMKYPSRFTANDTSSMAFYFDGVKIPGSQLLGDGAGSSGSKAYKYQPQLENGPHFLKLYGVNQSGTLENYPGFEKIFEVTDEVELLEVYNYPNPFSDYTNFTFQLTQVPDELKIKIYTVAGRLIKVLEIDGDQLKTNFNSIAWDGRDEDGDLISNGVYLYKIIARSDDDTSEIIQKLAVIR